MKVNGINTFNCSNNNIRPVFKQQQPPQQPTIAQKAIVDQFIESTSKKDDISSGNPFKLAANKLSTLKNILFSKETEESAKLLREALANYDSTNSILFKYWYAVLVEN